jgi:hypothetical protein
MAYFEVALLVAGLSLLIYGYRRDNRKLLLAAAIDGAARVRHVDRS